MVIQNLSRDVIIEQLTSMRYSSQRLEDNTRERLIRYYQHDNTASFVRTYFKGTSLQQIPTFTSNFTKRVIDARALVYKKAPEVMVDEKYTDYTGSLNSKRRQMEKMTYLLGTSAMLSKPHTKWYEGMEELTYDIIPYFRLFFLVGHDYPCAIAYPVSNYVPDDGYNLNKGTVWAVWTADYDSYKGEHFLFDGKNTIAPETDGVVNEEMINPYGILPVSFSSRMMRLGGDFMVPGAEDVIKTNHQMDIALTELALAYRFDAVGIKWIKGAEEITQIDSGVDKFILIPQEADIGRLGSATLSQLIDTVKFITEQCLQNNKLSVKWAGAGGQAKSAEALKMENIDNMEEREANAEDIWRVWENERFEIDRRILEVMGTPIAEDYRVNFTEPTPPMSQKEEREQWQWELDNNFVTPRDYLKWKNPDISEEELDERLGVIEIANQPKVGNGSLLQSLATPVVSA